MLINAIKNGKTWAQVAEMLPHRTVKHCRDRFNCVLNPYINHEDWTAEEDVRLMGLHTTLGNKWSLIAKQIPGRSSIQVKNRYNNVLSKQAQEKSK